MEVPLALPCLALVALCSDLCPIPGGEQGGVGKRGRGRGNTKGEDMGWEFGEDQVWHGLI